MSTHSSDGGRHAGAHRGDQSAANPSRDSGATTLDVFVQREGSRDLEHMEFDGELTLAELKAQLVAKHGLDGEVSLFVEDREEPVDDHHCAKTHAESKQIKVHVHRCRHVATSVAYNGKVVEHRFSPGTMVAHVKRWAAEREFGMSRDDAAEHVLQIVGTDDQPSGRTHLGTLTTCPKCSVAFDLVPEKRINGSCEEPS